MYICVDFDGTCVGNEYPKVGKDIGAVPVLKKLAEKHELILFTMRSGRELNDAIRWFNSNGIPLFGINHNPTQGKWTDSPKAYGQLYIDDAALGAPLTLLYKGEKARKPHLDWEIVSEMLKEMDLI